MYDGQNPPLFPSQNAIENNSHAAAMLLNGSTSVVSRHYNDILRMILGNIQNYDTRVINIEWVNVDNFEKIATLLYEQTRQYMLNLLNNEVNEVVCQTYRMYDNIFINQLAFPAFCIELVKNFNFTIAKVCELLYFLTWKKSDNLFFDLYSELLENRHLTFKTIRARWIAEEYSKFSNFDDLAIQNWNIEIFRLFFEKFLSDFRNQDEPALEEVLRRCEDLSKLDVIELFSKSSNLEHLLNEIKILEGIKYVKEICQIIDYNSEDESIYPVLKKLYFEKPDKFKDIWNMLKVFLDKKEEQFIPAKVCNIIMYSLNGDLYECIGRGEIELGVSDIYEQLLNKIHDNKGQSNVNDDETLGDDGATQIIEENELTDTIDEIEMILRSIEPLLKSQDPTGFNIFNEHTLLMSTVIKLCHRVNGKLPEEDTISKSFNAFPPGNFGGKNLAMMLVSLVYASYESEIDFIDLVTHNDVAAKNLFDNIKQYFHSQDIPICLSKQYSFLANKDKYKVRVGTLEQLLKLDLDEQNLENRVLLIDNSDYFLFENPIVRHTNQLSTLGTQHILNILKYILVQVEEKYTLYKNGELEENVYIEPTEQELLQYLKNCFIDNGRGTSSIQYRAENVKEKLDKFKISTTYDVSGHPVEDIFESSKTLYRDDIDESLTRENLRNMVPDDVSIVIGHLDFEFEQRKVWLQFKHRKDAAAFKKKNKAWKEIKVTVKKNQFMVTSTQKAAAIASDIENAKAIIRRLDKKRGVECFLFDSTDDNDPAPVLQRASAKRELTLTPYLDELIFYLRYVHLYCFYRRKQYCDLPDMLENGFLPGVRSSKSSSKKCLQAKFETGSEPDPYFECNNLSLGLSDLIDNLPLALKRYCVSQLNKWIETSYSAVLRSLTSAYDVNNALLDEFTPEDYDFLLRNESITNLSNSGYDKLFAYSSIQDQEYRQIYELQNGLSLTPINLPTRYTHIQEIIQKYGIVHCFSEPCFSENFSETKNEALMQVYKFNEVNIVLPYFKEVSPYEFPSLLFEEHNAWMEAILINIIHQLQLNNDVFVFCESDHIVYTQLLPKLKSKLNRHSLVETVSIITEATQVTVSLEHLAVVVATPDSARGINYNLNQERSVAGIYTCMTFIPLTRIQEEYCITKKLMGKVDYQNTYQYLIHHYSGESVRGISGNTNSSDKRVPSYFHRRSNTQPSFRHIIYPSNDESVNSVSDIIQQRNEYDRYYFDRRIKAQPTYRQLQHNLESLLKRNKLAQKAIGQYDYVKLQQAHAFWMKTNLERICLEETETLVNEHKNFIKGFGDNFVFLARELFFLINGRYGSFMNNNNLGIGDQHDAEKKREIERVLNSTIGKELTSIRGSRGSFNQDNASAAMALYYYAGYKIKKGGKKFSLIPYKEVLEIFELSKMLIERDIAAVYIELSKNIENRSELSQVIKVISNWIEILLDELSKTIENLKQQTEGSNLRMALESVLIPSLESFGGKDVGTDSVVKRALLHCKSFGFYGTIHLKYYDLEEAIPITGEDKFRRERKPARFRGVSTRFPKNVVKSVFTLRKQVTLPWSNEKTPSARSVISPKHILEDHLRKLGRSIEHHGTWLYTLSDKSSQRVELIFKELPLPKRLQNLANAFRLAIYFLDEIYIFPVDSPPVGIIPLSFSKTGDGILWKVRTQESYDLYDLFFGLYECHNFENIYEGFEEILNERKGSELS